jgi:hypothetical protein
MLALLFSPLFLSLSLILTIKSHASIFSSKIHIYWVAYSISGGYHPKIMRLLSNSCRKLLCRAEFQPEKKQAAGINSHLKSLMNFQHFLHIFSEGV